MRASLCPFGDGAVWIVARAKRSHPRVYRNDLSTSIPRGFLSRFFRVYQSRFGTVEEVVYGENCFPLGLGDALDDDVLFDWCRHRNAQVEEPRSPLVYETAVMVEDERQRLPTFRPHSVPIAHRPEERWPHAPSIRLAVELAYAQGDR